MHLKTCWVVLFALAGAAAAQPSFRTIGDLPGGQFYSIANGISADGNVVVGYSVSGSPEGLAIKWIDGVLTPIGDLPDGMVAGNAIAANADGSVIVGSGNGINGAEACEWYGSIGPIGVGGTLETAFFGSEASGVDASGRYAVGLYASNFTDSAACMWDNGTLIPLPFYGDGIVSFDYATAISSDASTIVGTCVNSRGDSLAAQVRFGEFSVLADFDSGENYCDANAVNADGTVVVGNGNTLIGGANRTVAARWVNGAIQNLGDLPGGIVLSNALAVSADGNTIVGYSSAGTGIVAFIWTPSTGMQSLQSVLVNQFNLGGQLGSFTMQKATGISADGLVICGYGQRANGATEGFVVNLRSGLLPCPADFNQDGGIDGSDLEAFFTTWQEGLPAGAVNQDGGVDGGDLEAFIVPWQNGGC